MSDADTKIQRWLKPLADASAPCGPDLEYDNEYLELAKAAAGKPESQFGPAEPPDWRSVLDRAADLLDRSRDLRIALFWLRAGLRTRGYGALSDGLKLLLGLVDTMWDDVHPKPDPEDNDPYARVNALMQLRSPADVLADVRAARLVEDRVAGVLDVRAVELAFGLGDPRSGEKVISRDQVGAMLGAALKEHPELRTAVDEAAALAKALSAQLDKKLSGTDMQDLKPLLALANAVVKAMPAAADDGDGEDDDEDDAPSPKGSKGARKAVPTGLTGTVTSREEAIRAIDLVCAYLEQTEPSNPAPLFLRRAKQLLTQNFLQALKVLAPEAMTAIAKSVGVDPASVTMPPNP